MPIDIFLASTDEDILACFPAFKELRPHLLSDVFLPQVRQQQNASYQILALRHDGIIKSAAGFRHAEFLAWGKVIYIDDLTTLSAARSQGYAEKLLDWIVDYAKVSGCDGIHLDTGYARHAAHRLYLRKGFQLSSHHMALKI
jgi:GNAT superfamily N-acetyltransferase